MRTARLLAYTTALLALAVILLTLQITHSPAQDVDREFSAAQRQAIDKLIHAYIVAHPEVLLEAQEALNARAETDRVDKIRRVLNEHRDALFRQEGDLVLGNPRGSVSIVEFYEYNCPYCKQVAPALARRLASDGNIKLILKPMPYLTKASAGVAYLAVASARQNKLAAFHAALLEAKGQSTEVSALKIAENVGLDVARLKQDATLPEVKAVVDRVQTLSHSLNIEGTPFFFVDDKYISGVPEDFEARLDRAIEDVRNHGCKLC